MLNYTRIQDHAHTRPYTMLHMQNRTRRTVHIKDHRGLHIQVHRWLALVHSFIHSDYFYSAASSPLLLRGAPDTAGILCRSFTPKRHIQLRVKDLPKVPTWRLERNSNMRFFGHAILRMYTNAPPRPAH